MPPADPPPSAFAESVAVVGVGLIGGSIGAALKRRGFPGRVIGVGRDQRRMQFAARVENLIDEPTDDLCAAAASADLIVFCTPVDRITDGVRACAPHCRPGTLLTDAGSIKGAICHELTGLPDGVTFVGSHPLAGSEKSGFEHARGDLFQDRVCVVTPRPDAPARQLERLTAFWRFLGMRVVAMTPEAHDETLAETSHLPHVAAAALAATLADDHRPFAATGFRDTTRVAAGDPDLWTAILLANAAPVLAALTRFETRLADFRRALEARDAPALKNLLTHAKTNRDALT